MAHTKKPKKPKIKVHSLKTPEQVKKAEQRISEFKKKLKAWEHAKNHKVMAKHHVKKGKERISKILSGL